MSEYGNNRGLGHSLSEIIEHLTALIHEEIELAKAEFAVALQSLIRGWVAGILGGIFAVFGGFILLIGLAFFINDATGWEDVIWPGFFIVAFGAFVIGAIAAWFAFRKLKKGSHIAPTQAIDEAKKTTDALRMVDTDGPQLFEAESVVEETEPAANAIGESGPAPKTADASAKRSSGDDSK